MWSEVSHAFRLDILYDIVGYIVGVRYCNNNIEEYHAVRGEMGEFIVVVVGVAEYSGNF